MRRTAAIMKSIVNGAIATGSLPIPVWNRCWIFSASICLTRALLKSRPASTSQSSYQRSDTGRKKLITDLPEKTLSNLNRPLRCTGIRQGFFMLCLLNRPHAAGASGYAFLAQKDSRPLRTAIKRGSKELKWGYDEKESYRGFCWPRFYITP